MKIYEAETLTAATKSRAKQYEELKKEVTALKKEFQGIVGLDNEFQGAGATAIKSFYEAQIEVADAWMELFTTQISFLEGIPASLEEADLSGNTVVEVPFLDGEVSNGINQAKSLVDQQANDLQRILNSIDDILPLDMFDQKDFNEKITLAGHRMDDTVTKVENVDRQLVEEYDVSIGQENVAVGLFRALLDATKQDGNISPMTFNQSAFKNSDVYQVKDEVAGQMKDYQTFKKEQAEARKIEQEMEELENRPWYEKAWDTTKTFTGEFTGYYDSIRASTGVDPVTGRKLSDAERIAAGAMAAAGFIPVVGWAGRAIKGGSALYKTAKGLNAADHALDAYKTTKGFSLLQKTEYGIYGLLAANGLGEAATGKDMFGNQLTEEQRQNGLLMALGIGGVAGAAKVADKVASGTKFVPYSKEFAQKQVQYAKATITDIARSGKNTLKNIGEEIGKKEIPKRISMEQVSLAGGPTLPQVVMEKQTIKEAYQKFTVKDSKVEGVSGESISKSTDKAYPTRQIDPVAEAHIIDRVKEIRGNLTSKYKKSGNFAIAEVKIAELSKKEFYAQSKIDSLSGNLVDKVPDISLQPDTPIFKASEAAGQDGKAYMRDSDTEYKILNDIAFRLGDNTHVSGDIKLFTELDTCASCNRVIAEFSAKYPNISLEVIHNNGERIKP
ncbi:deaminase domain-containing protein [Peribacillus frigoritolerans]|uniref:deaminase domain-containing protein n=1 Tax=Peribacillus frigoritolerans TaxID=450367 RepID=UPI00207ADAF3|nr:deaminase domain-containing protein [Peribacillus frigoritolerans]USK75488.1 pre-toxin TG domain-containing protein [Peribacillus frigoritolerans]